MMAPNGLLGVLPSPSHVADLLVGTKDVVIHAPGFEERTLALLNIVRGEPGASAILLDYRPYNAANRLGDVRSGLSAKGIETTDSGVVEYDRFDPTVYSEVLRHRLLERGARHAFVDVSTMSKLAVILTLKVCLELELE